MIFEVADEMASDVAQVVERSGPRGQKTREGVMEPKNGWGSEQKIWRGRRRVTSTQV